MRKNSQCPKLHSGGLDRYAGHLTRRRSVGSAQAMRSSPGVQHVPPEPRIPHREQRLLRERGGTRARVPPWMLPKGHSLGSPLSGHFLSVGQGWGRVLDG